MALETLWLNPAPQLCGLRPTALSAGGPWKDDAGVVR